jgi:L-ascorbate metabolism protein UlaG (beta-lactamase superfamily)
MKIKNIELEWLGHASVRIKTDKKIIYIDPYQLINEVKTKADIILITHSHYDHCSLQDIEKIVKDGTIIICTADSQSKITRINKKIKIGLIESGKGFNLEKIKIQAVPAYNINKKFHQKSEGWIGYIIQIGSVVIYHAGDADIIKEMEKLTGYSKKGNYFVALLPVGGTYTMDAEEAAKAASIIKPTLAIPIHWGSIIGSRDDAKKFVELCEEKGIKAEILKKS